MLQFCSLGADKIFIASTASFDRLPSKQQFLKQFAKLSDLT